MALDGRRVTVDATPTLVLGGDSGGTSGNVRNPTGSSATVYLGGSGVADTDGYALAAGEAVSVDLGPSEKLYAVCSSGQTADLHVLESGVG